MTVATLGDLVHELGVRLGFAFHGSAAAVQRDILRSFIRQAEYFLYWHLPDEEERFVSVVLAADGLGQSLFDLPDNMEIGKRFMVWWRKSQTDRWSRLVRDALLLDEVEETGNTPFTRATDVRVAGDVSHYRIVGRQIELSPATQGREGALRLVYMPQLAALRQDSDAVMMPPDTVLLLALANAKAHYQHPDAGQYAGMFEKMTRQLRATEHVDKRYLAGGR